MTWWLVLLVLVLGALVAAWWIDRSRKRAPLSSDPHVRRSDGPGDIGTGTGGMH